MSKKKLTVLVSIFVAAALAVIKTVIGLLTMSISVLASALDSLMDVFSMSVTMMAVSTSEKPADDKHQFGHGKAEAIGGLVQAVLIAVSAGFLIYQAFHRVIDGYKLDDEVLGIGVIVLSMVVSIFISHMLKVVGRRTESTALMAGSLNFGADVLSYFGVLVALVLEKWWHVKNADPIISMLISINIIVSAIRIGRDATTQLMDKTLPDETLKIIDHAIHSHGSYVRGYHKLRTRSVGAEKYIEFHLEIDRSASFESAHAVTEAIIADIQRAVPSSHVIAHSDPV